MYLSKHPTYQTTSTIQSPLVFFSFEGRNLNLSWHPMVCKMIVTKIEVEGRGFGLCYPPDGKCYRYATAWRVYSVGAMVNGVLFRKFRNFAGPFFAPYFSKVLILFSFQFLLGVQLKYFRGHSKWFFFCFSLFKDTIYKTTFGCTKSAPFWWNSLNTPRVGTGLIGWNSSLCLLLLLLNIKCHTEKI